MTTTEITTNHQWRDFVYHYDVPAEVLADQFDYHDPEEVHDGYFCYRGHWYHLDQFTRIPKGSDMLDKWDGAHADGFFCGVVVKLSDDGEQFKVGTYIARG
tara:strand:- start:5062 stop:5364 length:303 start_codon:yes stop_codon:yes gene_type:complete